jgi:hypothetical protein
MEPYFIAENRSYIDGYNLTTGGDGNYGAIRTDETRHKLSIAVKGRKDSNETRLKKSQAFTGRKQTPEWIEKRRRSSVGMVCVVDRGGVTRHVSVEMYNSQKHTGDLVTNSSLEGKRRLSEKQN